jgi:starvation-inducible outer membrane lipoprotein
VSILEHQFNLWVSILEQPSSILEQSGFLLPTTCAEGRLLTTTGTVVGTDRGEVGGMEYVYPMIGADDIYLWPRDSEDTYRGRFHFDIGVGLGL